MARLPRLRRDTPVVSNNVPSLPFQRDWQAVVDAIETQGENVTDIETAIAIIQARLDAAGIP